MPVTFPIRLNYADVVAAGRKAYEEGRLSAQGETPFCAYRDASGRPCVVGAALTDEQAAALGVNNEATVRELVQEGLLETDDLDALIRIQKAHDYWAEPAWPAEAPFRRAELVKLLGIKGAA